MTDQWSARLWSTINETYDAVLAHPFMSGITSGSLPTDTFAHYIAQDTHYLRDYARALMVVGAKAPTHADAGMFARHAAGTVDVELGLHSTLLAALGLSERDIDSIPVAPTTQAYTSYLLGVAHNGSFVDGLAAVLPCYWIYERVGQALVAQGSPDPRYQRWIDTYSGEEFARSVADVLTLTDRVGLTLSAGDAERAGEHFVQASRYEWMFWDAAWRREGWPI